LRARLFWKYALIANCSRRELFIFGQSVKDEDSAMRPTNSIVKRDQSCIMCGSYLTEQVFSENKNFSGNKLNKQTVSTPMLRA